MKKVFIFSLIILCMGCARAELKDEYFFVNDGETTHLYRISTELIASGDWESGYVHGGKLALAELRGEPGGINEPWSAVLFCDNGDIHEMQICAFGFYSLSDDLTVLSYDNGIGSRMAIYSDGKLHDVPYELTNYYTEWLHNDGGPIRVRQTDTVDDNNMYNIGYIDAKGNVLVPFIWKDGGIYSEGLAFVEDDMGNYGVIDNTGAFVILPDFDIWSHTDITEYVYFCDGLAPVSYGEHIVYIDKSGALAIPTRFSEGWQFHERRALVRNDEHEYYYIDTSGERISDATWDYGYDFNNGYAIVRDEHKRHGCIDTDGNITVQPQYAYITRANPQGTALIYTFAESGSGYEAVKVIDLATGNLLTDDIWEVNTSDDPDEIFYNPWGIYVLSQYGKDGVIDARGNILFAPIYDKIELSENGNLTLNMNDMQFCVLIP